MNTSNINPLDWHRTRFLDHIPAHFIKLKFNIPDLEKRKYMNWLVSNASGRIGFAENQPDVKDLETPRQYMTISRDTLIGFEDPRDATMYTMFSS